MKAFIAVSVAALALATYHSLQLTQLQSAPNRLGQIAEKINSMNLSWKAHDPIKFHKVSSAGLTAFTGLKYSEKPANIPWKKHSQDPTLLKGLPDNFDSR